MPRKRKQNTNFTETSKDVKTTMSRVIPTLTKKGKSNPWFCLLKYKNEEGSHGIQKEAFLAGAYRVCIGVRQPKIRELNDTHVISKEVNGFKPLKDCKVMTPHEAIKNGMAAALVTSFFFSEMDLNYYNIGINENNAIVRIDFEFSMYTGGHHPVIFPIEGIVNLPVFAAGMDPIKSWVGWDGCLNNLRTNECFIKDKYKSCLKILLFDPSVFESMAKDYLASGVDDSLLKDVFSRCTELKNYLLGHPEFNTYFTMHHASYWIEIQSEAKQYNAEIQVHIEKLDNRIKALQTDTTGNMHTQFTKEKYQNLSHEELLKKFQQEQADYRDRLINIEKMHKNYCHISKKLNVVVEQKSPSVPCANEAEQELTAEQINILQVMYGKIPSTGSMNSSGTLTLVFEEGQKEVITASRYYEMRQSVCVMHKKHLQDLNIYSNHMENLIIKFSYVWAKIARADTLTSVLRVDKEHENNPDQCATRILAMRNTLTNDFSKILQEDGWGVWLFKRLTVIPCILNAFGFTKSKGRKFVESLQGSQNTNKIRP